MAALLVVVTFAPAAGDALIAPENELGEQSPEWEELAAAFSRRPDVVAQFTERRVFPFREAPVTLSGEVRVSHTHGLSLHYDAPEVRTVIIDERGALVRDAKGRSAPPPDPRAGAVNAALRHVLDFNLAALRKEFTVYGRRAGGAWSLVLVPRAGTMRRAVGNIFVEGEADVVRRIELRRSPQQYIEITITEPRRVSGFDAAEVKRFFR